MDLYQSEILEHFKNPRHKGRLEVPTASVYSLNPTCGDTLGLDLVVKEGKIEDIGFWGEGCAISQAAMSMLTEQLLGQPVEALGRYSEDDILAMLGVKIGPNRRKCAFLSKDVLAKAYEKSKESEN